MQREVIKRKRVYVLNVVPSHSCTAYWGPLHQVTVRARTVEELIVTVMIWMVWTVHCFWKYQVAKRDVHVPHPQIPVLYLVQFSTRNASAFILRARHKLSATVTEDSSEFTEQFLLFSFHCKRSFKNKFSLLMGIKEVDAMGISVEFPQTSKQTNKK